MGNFNNAVYGYRGTQRIVVGFRCDTCGGIAQAMWGNTCNKCRDNERKHRELIEAIKATAKANSKADGY